MAEKLYKNFRDNFTVPGSSPFEKSGIVSRLFFLWIIPLIRHGSKVTLEQEDTYQLPLSEETIEEAHRKFKESLASVSKGRNNAKYLVLKAFFRLYKRKYALFFLMNLLIVAGNYFNTGMVYFGTQMIQKGEINPNAIGSFVLIFILGQITISVFRIHMYYLQTVHPAKLKAVLAKELYEKSLRMTINQNNQSLGKITNLLWSDASLVTTTLIFFRFVQILLGIILGFILLNRLIGPACYGGIPGVFIIGGVFSYFRAKVLVGLEKKQKDLKDERMKVSEEALSAIKYTKLYLLEGLVQERICQIRKKETENRKMILHLEWFQEILTRLIQPVNAALVLMLFYAWNSPDSLDASVLFTFFTCSTHLLFS